MRQQINLPPGVPVKGAPGSLTEDELFQLVAKFTPEDIREFAERVQPAYEALDIDLYFGRPTVEQIEEMVRERLSSLVPGHESFHAESGRIHAEYCLMSKGGRNRRRWAYLQVSFKFSETKTAGWDQ